MNEIENMTWSEACAHLGVLSRAMGGYMPEPNAPASTGDQLYELELVTGRLRELAEAAGLPA